MIARCGCTTAGRAFTYLLVGVQEEKDDSRPRSTRARLREALTSRAHTKVLDTFDLAFFV
jgi:hypothetical protein